MMGHERIFLTTPVLLVDDVGRVIQVEARELTAASQAALKALLMHAWLFGRDAEYERMQAAFRPRLREPVEAVVRIVE